MEARQALLARVSAAAGTEVRDPATGEVIGYVEFSAPEDVAKAVGRARDAQPGWAALSDAERAGYLLRCADAIEAHAEELAYAVSRETGKTLSGLGARYEIEGCAGWLRRVGLVAGPGGGAGGRGPAGGRHGVDQRARWHPPDDPVRRHQALRLRA